MSPRFRVFCALFMPTRSKVAPRQAVRLVMQALGGRVAIPLSLVRSRLSDLSDKVALELEAQGSALEVRGEAFALGAPIAFAARVEAEGVRVEGERRSVRLRLSEAELSTPEDAPGPLADAIRNHEIDTEHPATLIGNMISLPDVIVEAKDHDLVLDLMKLPAIQRDPMLREAFAAATSYVGVTGIGCRDDAIELELGLLPGGAKEAAVSTARVALYPVVHYLWPEGWR